MYELKFDGFRAEAIKNASKVHLRSRNDKDFNGRYSSSGCYRLRTRFRWHPHGSAQGAGQRCG
jgi:ATP-dependent DNA ligase